MKTKNLGDVVVLIRVAPYGTAEGEFMKNIDAIREATNYTELGCQLGALFGCTTPYGEPYNQYELDFDSERWLWYAHEFLIDWFDRLEVQGEMVPQVVAARRSLK